jgi:membrane protein
MLRHDAPHLAAGVAFFALFSLFPVLLGFLAVIGMLLDSEELEQDFVHVATGNLPLMEEFVSSNVHEIIHLRGTLGIAALVGIFWSGTAIFSAISRTVNLVWGVESRFPFYIAKPMQIVMGILLGILLLLSTAVSSLIGFYTSYDLGFPWQAFLVGLGLKTIILYIIPWSITLGIFLFIYWFVPNCETQWRYIWLGGLAAAVLFEVNRFIFVWYLENVAIYSQLYGSLASVMALLIWAYLSSLIFILGAEISVEYQRLYHPTDQEDDLAASQ